jgi:hypothetical protein
MGDSGNRANRQFFTLLAGVVMINVLYYVICGHLRGKNTFLPVMLQEGNWVYGVVVVPLVCVVFSLVEVAITRLRMGWTGCFLVCCLISSFAAANWAIYTFGGWLYA